VEDDMIDETSRATAEGLRNVLIDRLRDQGTVRTARVEAAMRAIPRHLFVPAVSVKDAYTDDPVYTKHDGAGASISAASQPSIVAMMLEQLQVEPGHRVIEIGAGTGYNAGLLAYLAGDDGHVTTIDVDDDIVEGARTGLAAAGIWNVRVVLGDGAVCL
jgi:protein-L-isoaspartate(D-aspartate) O-methyltransferase